MRKMSIHLMLLYCWSNRPLMKPWGPRHKGRGFSNRISSALSLGSWYLFCPLCSIFLEQKKKSIREATMSRVIFRNISKTCKQKSDLNRSLQRILIAIFLQFIPNKLSTSPKSEVPFPYLWKRTEITASINMQNRGTIHSVLMLSPSILFLSTPLL